MSVLQKGVLRSSSCTSLNPSFQCPSFSAHPAAVAQLCPLKWAKACKHEWNLNKAWSLINCIVNFLALILFYSCVRC